MATIALISSKNLGCWIWPLITLDLVRASYGKSNDGLSMKGGANGTFERGAQEDLDSMESGLG